MTFDRDRLPDPTSYYESQGLRLVGPRNAKWKTTECRFHGGSDSMRINTQSGAFVCMAACGARGGDVLAHEIATTGADFISAAKALGAWIDDGRPVKPQKPTPLSPRQALSALVFEATFVAVTAGNLRRGVNLAQHDFKRLLVAVGRINGIGGMFE